MEKDRMGTMEKAEKAEKRRTALRRIAVDLLVDVAAGMLIAIGTYNFAATMHFPLAGFNGIALIAYYLFGWPIGLVATLLNIPVAILCYKLLGRRFLLNSIKTMLIGNALIDLVAPLLPVYDGDILLAAICTGVLSGVGFALIFMRGSSTGGSDFVIMAVKAKRPHLSLGKISFVLDGLIILAGAFFTGSGIDGVLYGILIVFILSVVLDKVMYGVNAAKFAVIVTDFPAELAVAIDEHVDRGTTLIEAEGGHSGSAKNVVMCACDNKQLYRVRELVREVDPEAFMIIMDSSEVAGKGFRGL